MEYVGLKNIKKFCNFYVSDVHLSVMLLPYISKQMNEDVEITTIFEEIKKENIEEILEKINVKNKNEILKLNWTNNEFNMYDEIEEKIDGNIKLNKNNTIIIGGNKEYIEENNKKIIEMLNKKNLKNLKIKIINCYSIEEVENDIKNIVQEYDGILNTSGEILKK